MTENENFKIIMNMLLKKNEKDYIILIAYNKDSDFAIFIVRQSSYVYSSKYILEDFKKINFFKNYLNFGLNQCIEIMMNLLKDKQGLINIEENENVFVKLCLDIEINVVGLNLNLPKEKIEILLKNENIEQIIKNNIIWDCLFNLLNEKEEDKKKLIEQDNMINELKREISALNLGNNLKNDLIKSKIINEKNKKNFEFVQNRLKLFNKDKTITYHLLYSVRINGDKSQTFHNLCDNHKNTLTIIKTDQNIIFGAFANKKWNSLDLGRKKDIKSFVFSLYKQKIYNSKMDAKYHLYCSENDGPCFYAFSIDNLCLQNGGYCDEIYKCNYDSFESEYELNNGIKQFKIDELEIYEIKLI